MACAKLKCVQCKDRYPREDMIRTPAGNFCTHAHAIEYANKKKASNKFKAKKQKDKEFKDKFYENDTKTRKDAAQKAFNNFIRERDKDQPCISCGRYHTGRYDAGHYKTIGAHSELRFHEDNCHKQCHWDCNINKSGNIANYRINLVKKIGIERVEALESFNEPKEYSAQDYKEIELHYKQKLKEIQNE